jgi:hypothetical protein
MKFRYSPFEKKIEDVQASDLGMLRSVSEGWYVEYKAQVIPVKNLAKSLSSFANQYGGWLILGVKENHETHTAESFPGVATTDVNRLFQSLKEAARTALNPEVFYTTKEFKGPIDDIELSQDRSIIAVRIPPGAETPYIHADGKIYLRIADSSEPKPATDRATLERLWERSDKSSDKLANFAKKIPTTSEGEKDNCFLHLSIFSDPYEMKNDKFNGNFDDFVKIMKTAPIPFDNFYTQSTGFIARQIASHNDPHRRLFTWEFDRHCYSFITLPFVFFTGPYLHSLAPYSIGVNFNKLLTEAHIRHSRLLELNILLHSLHAILIRHRELAYKAGIHGPFFVKAHLQNVWRTVPFLDMPSLLMHISEHGFPVVQEDNVLTPPGTGLETFVVLPERDFTSKSLSRDIVSDLVLVFLPILEALGIPREFIAKKDALKELQSVMERFNEAQASRNRRRQE